MEPCTSRALWWLVEVTPYRVATCQTCSAAYINVGSASHSDLTCLSFGCILPLLRGRGPCRSAKRAPFTWPGRSSRCIARLQTHGGDRQRCKFINRRQKTTCLGIVRVDERDREYLSYARLPQVIRTGILRDGIVHVIERILRDSAYR